jgi:hypothetical protein
VGGFRMTRPQACSPAARRHGFYSPRGFAAAGAVADGLAPGT